MSKVRVGVLIPAYQAEAFVATAIESVLAQTWNGEIEILVLDDASTDDTAGAVAPFLDDPRVHYRRNDKNLGMSGNWNRGLSMLDQPLVAKLDADDFWHPDFLAETVPALARQPNVGLVFTAITRRIATTGEDELFRPYTSSWCMQGHAFRAHLVRWLTAWGSAMLVRRECYDRLGGFLDAMRIHSDWEMWVRIVSHYDAAYVDRPLCTMLRHPQSCTSQAAADTRSTDDLALWLGRLDLGALPYTLEADDRRGLEAAMLRMTRHRLFAALGPTVAERGSDVTAAACLDFLATRSSLVPWWERRRFALARDLLHAALPSAARLALRGSRSTARAWPLEPILGQKKGAADPDRALGRRHLV
ncbi:MAG: glycosyltransferase family 2 protein [Acidobacteriota bacterium]